MKRNVKNLFLTGTILGGIFAGIKTVACCRTEETSIDNDNPYIDSLIKRKDKITPNFYEGKVKPKADRIFSFAGLLLLTPLYAVISIAVYIDDPGPVFFTQKRVGKDGRFFMLHKYRSMKLSTPHDVPTHELKDAEKYITRMGKVLRQTSLDELPQIWDIFRGKMSIIGPRPALWNQEDLVAEREKWGANHVFPGLTGLAQIKGRDELLIQDKAAMDGEYVRVLHKGGWEAAWQDIRCFMDTVTAVVRRQGVVEGGTGRLQNPPRAFLADRITETAQTISHKAGFESYGYLKTFCIDKKEKKKVLITGAGSYIGESFQHYVIERYPNLDTTTIDMLDENWKYHSFNGFDAVFHVAGIAHVDNGYVNEEVKKKYYSVNRDLAIETAMKAKEAGVKQFLLLSSMIVYGDSVQYGQDKVIDKHTIPLPASFYGDSKWQGEIGVRELADDYFAVAVLRLPMVYGYGCKGNYPVLAKLARMSPVFPDVQNRRSMIYIGNLCEFVSQLILSGQGGIYFPQNATYTKTAEMVKEISRVHGRMIRLTGALTPAVFILSKVPGKIGKLVNKAFGNSCYEERLSKYDGIDYQRIGLAESIKRTELEMSQRKHKKVLFLVNHDIVIYNFRLELVERLLDSGFEVHISSPYGERIKKLQELGCHYHAMEMERHGMDPKKELGLLAAYKELMVEVKPDMVFTYTIKPNVYGGMVCAWLKIPYIANVTGLGTAVENGGPMQKITLSLYKQGLKKAQMVFFQNWENRDFMIQKGIIRGRYGLLPGSGVNLEQYSYMEYPRSDDPVIFVTIGRLMKDKGTDELLETARIIRKRHPHVVFRLIGDYDENIYREKVNSAVKAGLIEYYGSQTDVRPFLKDCHALIHASYHEGMSNVLLEAAASGRPVIATDVPGCIETFTPGVSGIACKAGNVGSFVEAVERFLKMSPAEKQEMGRMGRKKAEAKFDRKIIVDAYMKELRMSAGIHEKRHAAMAE